MKRKIRLGKQRRYPLDELVEAVQTHSFDFKKSTVNFLLGTDRYIENEKRVGLIPQDIGKLHHALRDLGLSAEVYVIRAAGERAGFVDEEYATSGATIVKEDELSKLPGIDVVHALKQPTEIEAEIPGRFLRLGALHLVTKPRETIAVLRKKNFAALFDGGTIGDCSYVLSGSDKTPVVASMSRIAGDIAASEVLKFGDLRSDKVIVVGAGNAGTRSILRLIDQVSDIVVIEIEPKLHKTIAYLLSKAGFPNYTILKELPAEVFKDAAGVIFAPSQGPLGAEEVCTFTDICSMKTNACIADIAIDQGGSIYLESINKSDDVQTRIVKYRNALEANGYRYFAEPNIPAREPNKASIMHSSAVLPSCVALLVLCALYGDPESAARELLSRDWKKITEYKELSQEHRIDFYQCMMQDLRNGLQVSVRNGKLIVEDPRLDKKQDLKQWLQQFQ